jgi:tetratricopeptide (TPR) repeat protein
MSEAYRDNVISTIVEEIGRLTGGSFEKFGYMVLRAMHPGEWTERGTTIDGAPRGYTVDTSAAGGELVGEMSSEADYFGGDLPKPRKDLAHAVTLHPQVKRIWLLSSREARAGETTKIANLETEFAGRSPATHVRIMDSRSIAGVIFENLESERLVRDLVAYLRSLGRLAEEHAFSHHVPSYPGYLPRRGIEQAVIERLAVAPCAVLRGISGIGKSALAAHVAEQLKREFDLVIWHEAPTLREARHLSDVEVRRTGTHHNIASLLRKHRCLLVLDDAVLSPDQVASVNWGSSKVLLTCQTSSDTAAITVGDLDPTTAQAVLEAGTRERCPTSVAQRVLASVGGHPLLLRALNQVASAEGWDAVDACCADAVSSIEDERHAKACDRILQRHTSDLGVELQFVKWCGASRFDAELAAACVSSRAVANLRKRAFLAATASGDVRVHDVVYRSIQAVVEVAPEREAAFRDSLDGFIRTEQERGDLLVRRAARLHSGLLLRLLRSGPRPSFIYAVALGRTAETSSEVFGDIVAAAKQLASERTWHGREVEVRALIESVEAVYTLTSVASGTEAARESLKRNIVALQLLCGSPAASGEMLRDLRHHHAKMLERLGRYGDAETEFRSILSDYPRFTAARLQLARILEKTSRKSESLTECRGILSIHEADEGAVPSAVLLETLKLVAGQGSHAEVQALQPVMMRSVARAHDLDRGHAFQLIASVSQKTHYTMPELTLGLFAAIDWGDSLPASDSERFDWAQAHKAAAKAVGISDPRRNEFLSAADEVCSAIASPNGYQKIQHSEALILLGRHRDANSRLDEVAERDRKPFWWQRKAQALSGLERHAEALEAINAALQGGADKKFNAAFLHDRFLFRRALSDPNATDDLRAAIAALPAGDKYRIQLEAELAAVQDSV